MHETRYENNCHVEPTVDIGASFKTWSGHNVLDLYIHVLYKQDYEDGFVVRLSHVTFTKARVSNIVVASIEVPSPLHESQNTRWRSLLYSPNGRHQIITPDLVKNSHYPRFILHLVD
jgi:hypothetical protein